jgi:hypothetical protein
MPLSPRAEALRLIQSGATIEPPEVPDMEPNSPEALDYIDSFKEKHFVVLAQTMDLLIGHAVENRQPDDRSLQPSRGVPKNRWQEIADKWRVDLEKSREAISSTETYQVADEFARVTGTLNTWRHISLKDKMMGGINTGLTSSFMLLRNVPHLTRYHLETGQTADPGEIARHPRSLELIRRLAKLSIDQMMAARSILIGDSQNVSGADFDTLLLPHHFRLHIYPDDSRSLGYAGFDELKVPAGYEPRDPFEPVKEPTLLKDIPSSTNKVIGCPITLPITDNRLGQIWNWAIDLVKANGLWDEEWPLPTTDIKKPVLCRPS